MAELKVVQLPNLCGDAPAQLRALAEEIEAGDFGNRVAVVAIINGDDAIQVRGYGSADIDRALATLSLGQAWLCANTLKGMDDG